jgi:hypothetical protein
MSYIDTYKNRLNAYGSSIKDIYINSTIETVDNVFSDNPSYQQVSINNIQVDTIITKEDTSDKKILLFRPGVSYGKGTVVTISSNSYLMTDFQDDPIYPTAIIQLCNNTLNIYHDETVISDYDSTGNPIYSTEPVPVLYFSIPCIVQEMADLYNSAISQSISYANTDVALKVQNRTSLATDLTNQTFQMFENTYHIYGFQRHETFNNDRGLLIVLAHNIASESGGST